MEPSRFPYPENNDKYPPDAIERFRLLALATPTILDRLCAQADMNLFIRLMVELGREHGEHFTADEVRAMLRTRRSEWLQQIML